MRDGPDAWWEVQMWNEIVEALLLEITVVRTEDGAITALIDGKSYPGGSSLTWNIEPCSDASSLSRELASLVERSCSTFLDTTT